MYRTLIRTSLIAATVAFVSSTLASTSMATDWTDITFPNKKHDFGTCAVAAKTEYRFSVFNQFQQNLHIQTVRASCGCTTPVIETPTIAPGQTGTILARFNTDTFKGQKGATLTVVIDQPFYTEVQLRVDGYIRSDMVFHPGSVDFGTVNQGEASTKSSKVFYAGRTDWEILGVNSNKPWLIPTVTEVSRSGGSIQYELGLTLSDSAPKGFFQDQIVVTTNDSAMPRVPLPTTGFVESPLSISPQSIALGSLKPGQSINQRLVIKGRVPFVVESINADGWEVDFKPSTTARTTHMITAKFTPTGAVGPQKVDVEIRTNGNSKAIAKATLIAEVRDR